MQNPPQPAPVVSAAPVAPKKGISKWVFIGCGGCLLLAILVVVAFAALFGGTFYFISQAANGTLKDYPQYPSASQSSVNISNNVTTVVLNSNDSCDKVEKYYEQNLKDGFSNVAYDSNSNTLTFTRDAQPQGQAQVTFSPQGSSCTYTVVITRR